MGNCACYADSKLPLVKIHKIPEPLIYKEHSFLVLHYTYSSVNYPCFEVCRAHLEDSMVAEIEKLGVVSEEGEVVQVLIYVGGSGWQDGDSAMLIEVVDAQIIIQFGRARVIQLLLARYKTRTLVHFKPQPQVFQHNLVHLVEKIYEKACLQAHEVSSSKRLMRYLTHLTNLSSVN